MQQLTEPVSVLSEDHSNHLSTIIQKNKTLSSALRRLLRSERDTNLNSVGCLFRNWESLNLLALGAS